MAKEIVGMKVTKRDGQYIWTFAMDGRNLYEILCSQVAWTLLTTSGKTKEEVQNMTILCIDGSNDKTEEELAAIRNPFIRAVLTEKKRLGLKEIYIEEDKHED